MFLKNVKKEYIKEKGSYYSCQYLVVFCTKYKRRFLGPEIQEFLKKFFYKTADEFDFKICSLNILENQVFLTIDCNPKFGINKAVTKLKNNSSSVLRKKFPHLEKRVPSIWTRKTFISTMGSVDLEDVNEFLSIQKKY